jgi:hypothetical protein
LGEEGGIRRIPLKKLWNFTTNQLSFQNLVELILNFTNNNNLNTDSSSIQVMVSYTDMDGDIISVSSDDELLDAFEQYENQVPPVLRAKAHIKVMTKGEKKKGDKKKKKDYIGDVDETITPTKDENNNNHKEEVKKNLGVTENIASDDNGRPKQQAKEGPTTTTPAVCNNIHPIPTDFDPQFVHGRHTCDGCLVTPIVGYRYHAINLPDYDLCQKCVNNYMGSEIEFQPIQLERDVSNQFKWKRRQERLAAAAASASAAQSTTPLTGPNNQKVNYPACRRTQKLGLNGVNPHQLFEMNLQEAVRRSLEETKKKSTTKKSTDDEGGEGPKVVVEEGSTPTPAVQSNVHKEKEDMNSKSLSECFKDLILEVSVDNDVPAGTTSTSDGKDDSSPKKENFAMPHARVVFDCALKEVDRAFKEAIRHSLRNVNGKVPMNNNNNKGGNANKAEVKVPNTTSSTKECVEEKEEVKVDVNVPTPTAADSTPKDPQEKEGDEKISSTSTVHSTANDSVVDNVQDTIPQDPKADETVVDNTVPESNDKNLVDTNHVVDTSPNTVDLPQPIVITGATILDGNDNTPEPKPIIEEWQMIDENGQITSDEMIAQAAQLIGSALFNSDNDMDASNAISTSSTITSVPTIVPSVVSSKNKSKGEISNVVLSRWDEELRQLHQMGFVDDYASVDVLERLEAANVGVDSEDALDLNNVVNHLLGTNE